MFINVCSVGSVHIQRMILANGLTIDGGDDVEYEGEDGSLEIDLDEMDATHFNTGDAGGDEVTFEWLVHKLQELKDGIMIDDNRVTFNKDGSIGVGCTTVTKEQIKKIYERSQKGRG